MDKLKSFFTKDTSWKLLSLVIALFLWFMVINIENPIETRTFTTYVEVVNSGTLAEKGFILSNEDDIEKTKVDIKIRSQRLTL